MTVKAKTAEAKSAEAQPDDERIAGLEKEVAVLKEIMRRNGWTVPEGK